MASTMSKMHQLLCIPLGAGSTSSKMNDISWIMTCKFWIMEWLQQYEMPQRVQCVITMQFQVFSHFLWNFSHKDAAMAAITNQRSTGSNLRFWKRLPILQDEMSIKSYDSWRHRFISHHQYKRSFWAPWGEIKNNVDWPFYYYYKCSNNTWE